MIVFALLVTILLHVYTTTMAKSKLTLSIEEATIRELKKAAIDKGITLSDFLAQAGTATISRLNPSYEGVKMKDGTPAIREIKDLEMADGSPAVAK